jgi:hypothetical protein
MIIDHLLITLIYFLLCVILIIFIKILFTFSISSRTFFEQFKDIKSFLSFGLENLKFNDSYKTCVEDEDVIPADQKQSLLNSFRCLETNSNINNNVCKSEEESTEKDNIIRKRNINEASIFDKNDNMSDDLKKKNFDKGKKKLHKSGTIFDVLNEVTDNITKINDITNKCIANDILMKSNKLNNEQTK